MPGAVGSSEEVASSVVEGLEESAGDFGYFLEKKDREKKVGLKAYIHDHKLVLF